MYQYLDKYTVQVKQPEREIVGREREMRRVLAALMRPELCNVILLGEAGSGKTALVQGVMMADTNRLYLEVDLSKMIADITNDPNEMAATLKSLFDDASFYYQTEHTELVLFIDEFHQIVQLSAAAVEALKPLLADSGTRGVRVIAATTYIEFRKFISPNQPLVERLQRVNIVQPDKAMTVDILKGMAKRYGVDDQFYNDYLFEMIYEYTNRYIPANSQPRKSILVLDSMVGWHRSEKRKLDMKLLSDVIYESEGVNVAFRVDAKTIKKELDKYVLSQEFATTVIEDRLQVCVADLNDHTKPMSSFLFTGSSGVGKAIIDSERVPVYTEDGSVAFKRNGDLAIGDKVFNRYGKPVLVVGVYPQGICDVYRVTLCDGRTLDVNGSHLWGVYLRGSSKEQGLTIYSTETLLKKSLVAKQGDRRSIKYAIPMNQAVAWSEQLCEIDPYVAGAWIGNGDVSTEGLTFFSNDEFIIKKVSNSLHHDYELCGASHRKCNIQYAVANQGQGQTYGSRRKYIQSWTINAPTSFFMYMSPRRIPMCYMRGSIDQRWSFVQGLFDIDGCIGAFDGDRFRVSYATIHERLAEDIQDMLFSLGISSTIQRHERAVTDGCNRMEYVVCVNCRNVDKWRFFTLPRKLELAKKSATVNKQRETSFGYVGICSIEKLKKKESMTCIYIDDEEHLYQAGQFVVTHNTEMAKQLARLLFEDDRNLIRLDMTEYAHDSSLERFRSEITNRIWEHPYSIVLLDEIEKACASVTTILLQVLDDGRLVDVNNREVSFVNAYLILTTNAGSEIYKNIAQYNVDDTGSGEQMKRYHKLIRTSISSTTGNNRFPPELLGRIDAIVPFQPLSESTMKQIVKMKLYKLRDEVRAKHGVDLKLQKTIIRYLVEDNLDTDSNSGGARNVVSKLESEVTTAVSRFINANPNVHTVGVSVRGELASDHKNKLASEAYIDVVAAN